MTRDEALWDLAKRAGAIGRVVEPVFVKQGWEWGGWGSPSEVPSADRIARTIVYLAESLAGREGRETSTGRLVVGVTEDEGDWETYVYLDVSEVA